MAVSLIRLSCHEKGRNISIRKLGFIGIAFRLNRPIRTILVQSDQVNARILTSRHVCRGFIPHPYLLYLLRPSRVVLKEILDRVFKPSPLFALISRISNDVLENLIYGGHSNP